MKCKLAEVRIGLNLVRRSRSGERSRRPRHSPSYERGAGADRAIIDKDWDKEREKRKKEREAGKMVAGPGGAGTSGAPLTQEDFEGKTDEEIEMMKIMGFSGFNTSKNKQVKGNDVGDVHLITKRKYRQYMNRKGGFNRPLDYVT